MAKDGKQKDGKQKPSGRDGKPKETQQPSAQGEPTIIIAAEERSGIKTVDINKDTLKLKGQPDKTKNKDKK